MSATSLAPQTAVFRLLCPEAHTSSRWLQFSLSEPNNYVAANPLRSGRRNRTKESIDTVCHRHPDFYIGKADLTSLPASDTVATPTAILSTSLGKYQLLWRVVGFTFTHPESTLKLRIIVLGIYLDRTVCNRILHLQGLPHCEYDSAYPFTVEHSCDSTRNPDGSCLDISATNAMLSPRAITLRMRLECMNSEDDWAWILHALAHVNGAEWWRKEPVVRVGSTGSMQVLKA